MTSVSRQQATATTTTATSPLTPSIRSDRFAHLNQFHLKKQYTDSGTLPTHHYETHLSPLRSQIRSLLIPLILKETPIIAKVQDLLRCDILDYFFAHTANLASHTFYVIFTPLPIWFGLSPLTRTMVFVLGYGIFFTGALKDWLCLPRPGSPPVSRVTLSGYTAREYGFPSSHSANASGVSLLLVLIILKNAEWFESQWTLGLSLAAVAIYWTSLIFGRVYCGMHGFSDISVGSAIGVSVLVFRLYFQETWDRLIMFQQGASIWFVLLATLFNYALVAFHPLPIDDCPCYDDSVAFIGVIIGLEWASWWIVNVTGLEDSSIPYSFEQLGVWKTALRVAVGVFLVVLWKEVVSKPVLNRILGPLFKGRPSVQLTYSEILRQVNPQQSQAGQGQGHLHNDVDYISLIQDRHDTDKLAHSSFKCSVFKKHRSFDKEILVRLAVYAGIPWVSIVCFNFSVQLLGLAAN